MISDFSIVFTDFPSGTKSAKVQELLAEIKKGSQTEPVYTSIIPRLDKAYVDLKPSNQVSTQLDFADFENREEEDDDSDGESKIKNETEIASKKNPEFEPKDPLVSLNLDVFLVFVSFKSNQSKKKFVKFFNVRQLILQIIKRKI